MVENSKPISISCGSDESGKGDYFGGLVVCALALTEESLEAVKGLISVAPPRGIKTFPSDLKIDSKLFGDKDIVFWVENYLSLIFDNLHSIYELTAKEYNQEYKAVPNLNSILSKAHNSAWLRLAEKVNVQNSVIDCFAPLPKYYEYLKTCGVSQIFKVCDAVTKAETKFLAVGLASLFARYHCTKQKEVIGNEIWGKVAPTGVSYQSHTPHMRFFKALVQKLGLEKATQDCCKAHFKCGPIFQKKLIKAY